MARPPPLEGVDNPSTCGLCSHAKKKKKGKSPIVAEFVCQCLACSVPKLNPRSRFPLSSQDSRDLSRPKLTARSILACATRYRQYAVLHTFGRGGSGERERIPSSGEPRGTQSLIPLAWRIPKKRNSSRRRDEDGAYSAARVRVSRATGRWYVRPAGRPFARLRGCYVCRR